MYIFFFFFFHHTAPTEIYTLSLHDALPIWGRYLLRHLRLSDHRNHPQADAVEHVQHRGFLCPPGPPHLSGVDQDRKSTRLNSSHGYISYAVFCLKKKKNKIPNNNNKEDIRL